MVGWHTTGTNSTTSELLDLNKEKKPNKPITIKLYLFLRGLSSEPLVSLVSGGSLVQWVQQIFLASWQAWPWLQRAPSFTVSSALLAFLLHISILINMASDRGKSRQSRWTVSVWWTCAKINIRDVKVSAHAKRVNCEGDEQAKCDFIHIEHLYVPDRIVLLIPECKEHSLYIF